MSDSKEKLSVRQMCIFAMLGVLMFLSKLALEALPNIHAVGMLTMVYTIVYRKKALIPLYIYVILCGIYAGFNLWWIPYIYIWTVLWGATMLLPRKIPDRIKMIVYPSVCALHGILFGTLYAPCQALILHFSFKQTIAWIVSGIFPFDVLHAAGNFAFGLLIVPLVKVLNLLELRS